MVDRRDELRLYGTLRLLMVRVLAAIIGGCLAKEIGGDLIGMCVLGCVLKVGSRCV